MSNLYIFADEAGDFTFKVKPGASRYFLLCTISTEDCKASHDLLALRRELALEGEPERDKLHCTTDKQAVRDKVFEVLRPLNFRIDATLLEKTKAEPHIRASDATFYKFAWYYHFKHVGPILLRDANKALITAAALGHKKTRAAFKEGVNNTVQQILPRSQWEVAFMESSQDPLLWAADYCAWAIQRKWESGDARSYDLISDKIKTQYDLWKIGTRHYYA